MLNQSKYKYFRKMIIEISVSLIIACIGLLCFHSNNAVLQESTTSTNINNKNSISSTNENQEIAFESPAEETANTITKSESTNKNSSSTKTSSSSSSQSSFTNKFGTSSTKCAHPGCNNMIASSGDTNCCTIHSKKCLECGKYIDEDALYCMDCITRAATETTTQNATTFTNKYGSSSTKCAHPGCNNPIAPSGDTNCCTLHSKRCLECGKYIDEDATYCMDCITNAVTGSKTQSSGSSSSRAFSNEYGTSTTKCAYPGCNNPIASSGDTNCCVAHSNHCLECGKLIDGDATYCMSCLTKALKPSDSKSTGGSSDSLDFSGYSDSMSDAEFDAWLDDLLGDY